MIRKQEGETIEDMLRRFKRELHRDKKIEDYKKHLHFMSNNTRRRLRALHKMRKI